MITNVAFPEDSSATQALTRGDAIGVALPFPSACVGERAGLGGLLSRTIDFVRPECVNQFHIRRRIYACTVCKSRQKGNITTLMGRKINRFDYTYWTQFE